MLNNQRVIFILCHFWDTMGIHQSSHVFMHPHFHALHWLPKRDQHSRHEHFPLPSRDLPIKKKYGLVNRIPMVNDCKPGKKTNLDQLRST